MSVHVRTNIFTYKDADYLTRKQQLLRNKKDGNRLLLSDKQEYKMGIQLSIYKKTRPLHGRGRELKPEIKTYWLSISYMGRKEATRTPDPYVPNVVRYQLRYFPMFLFDDAKVGISSGLTKLFATFSSTHAL